MESYSVSNEEDLGKQSYILFQNLSRGFREENNLRIASCPHSARSPHSKEPCFLTDLNFVNNFEMGHPRNIPVKVFQNLTSSSREEDLKKKIA